MRSVAKSKSRRRERDDEDLPAAAWSLRYIESSALVAALVERDAEALAALREIGRRVTSALTFTEAARALLRARIERRISPSIEAAALRGLETFARRCEVIELSGRATQPSQRVPHPAHLAFIERSPGTCHHPG